MGPAAYRDLLRSIVEPNTDNRCVNLCWRQVAVGVGVGSLSVLASPRIRFRDIHRALRGLHREKGGSPGRHRLLGIAADRDRATRGVGRSGVPFYAPTPG
jgi:hypothetical protein